MVVWNERTYRGIIYHNITTQFIKKNMLTCWPISVKENKFWMKLKVIKLWGEWGYVYNNMGYSIFLYYSLAYF